MEQCVLPLEDMSGATMKLEYRMQSNPAKMPGPRGIGCQVNQGLISQVRTYLGRMGKNLKTR